MKKQFSSKKSSIGFLFHRNLRLEDNLALNKCKGCKILPIFILDERQIDSKKNKYFSPFAVGFMFQSLLSLCLELKNKESFLVVKKGNLVKKLNKIINLFDLEAIVVAQDYTPFAIERSKELKTKLDCEFYEFSDYLLFDPETIQNGKGKTYKVFSKFYSIAKNKKFKQPKTEINLNFFPETEIFKSIQKKEIEKNFKFLENISLFAPDYVPGGRDEGLKRLEALGKILKNYDTDHNNLNFQTSHLSAYIKFGCVSIREVFKKAKKIIKISKEFQRQIIWREYYYHYFFAYPEELEWDNREKIARFKKTEMPEIVLAGYNQLTETGFMHNRARLIFADWALKKKKFYWRQCDIFFAKYLVDYDPIINAGNWKWVAKQPKFKEFNTSLQQKKYDPENEYIEKFR